MNYLKNVWTRVKISGVFVAMYVGSLLAIFTFPITYWFFGVSPERVVGWGVDAIESISPSRF